MATLLSKYIGKTPVGRLVTGLSTLKYRQVTFMAGNDLKNQHLT